MVNVCDVNTNDYVLGDIQDGRINTHLVVSTKKLRRTSMTDLTGKLNSGHAKLCSKAGYSVGFSAITFTIHLIDHIQLIQAEGMQAFLHSIIHLGGPSLPQEPALVTFQGTIE